MLETAMRTVRLGLIPFGLAGCTIQMPETMGQDPKPELPAPMDFYIPTGDNADRVHVVSELYQVTGDASKALLCLELVNITWWKGLGVGRAEPTLEVQDNDKIRCTNVPAAQVSITFWKAKMLGVHSQLGGAILDLRGYGSHKVSLRWTAD